MNQSLVAHVTAEVVIVGGLAYYFMKKTKQAEEQIQSLQTRVQELDQKVKSADKHIQTLYQMIEGLAEQSAPPPRQRNTFGRRPNPSSIDSFEPETLRNRKQKIKVVPIPVEEDEDIIELQPSNSSPNVAPSGPLGMGGFPLGAIFEMMGPGSMGGFFQSPESSTSEQLKPQVIIEDDDNDDQDIQDELKELGVEPQDGLLK